MAVAMQREGLAEQVIPFCDFCVWAALPLLGSGHHLTSALLRVGCSGRQDSRAQQGIPSCSP